MYLSATVYIDKKPYMLPGSHAGVIEHNGRFLMVDIVDIVDERLSIVDMLTGNQMIQVPIQAKRALITDNRVYVLSQDKFSEIVLKDLGANTHIGIKTSWGILPSSYAVFRGFVLSDVLGVPHVYIPFKEGSCTILAVPVLKGYKVIDAKYENRVMILLVADKSGQYDEITLRFNETLNAFTVVCNSDVTLAGVNFVSLPNGVFISYTGDGDLELSTVATDQKKVLTKVGLDKNAVLCHNGLDVHFYAGTKLYSVKMK